MLIFLHTLHIILCFALILIILLQPGKDDAAVFGGGGGGNQMYGPRGQANLLTRATTAAAALFMVTSISLAWYSNERTSSGSQIDDALDRVSKGRKKASITGATLKLGEEGSAPAEAPAPPPELPSAAPAEPISPPAAELPSAPADGAPTAAPEELGAPTEAAPPPAGAPVPAP